MSLQVYYPQDIKRVLAALASAGDLHGPEYRKALHDVALAFGVDLSRHRDKLSWTVLDAPALALQEGR